MKSATAETVVDHPQTKPTTTKQTKPTGVAPSFKIRRHPAGSPLNAPAKTKESRRRRTKTLNNAGAPSERQRVSNYRNEGPLFPTAEERHRAVGIATERNQPPPLQPRMAQVHPVNAVLLGCTCRRING